MISGTGRHCDCPTPRVPAFGAAGQFSVNGPRTLLVVDRLFHRNLVARLALQACADFFGTDAAGGAGSDQRDLPNDVGRWLVIHAADPLSSSLRAR